MKAYLPKRLAARCLFVLACLIIYSLSASAQTAVTAVYTDYNGYWYSSASSPSAVKPDNSHNLLAFTWNGTTYSTGVDDATLDAHSVTYSPLNFRAFPVNSVPNTSGGFYFVMLGEKYDGIASGVDNSATSPFPANPGSAQLASFLTDGKKGLDLGTGLANIPAGSTIRFNLSTNGITPAAIGDGVPDVLVSQLASPSGANVDVFRFVDINGNTVGNSYSVNMSSIAAVGSWQADFYELNSTQPSGTYINGNRPVAFLAVDLSSFGITALNYSNAVALEYSPNGTSDPGFVAFNEPAISVATQLSLLASPATYDSGQPLSTAPKVQVKDGLGTNILQSGIPVTVTVSAGTATLGGTTTVNTDANGIATFADLLINGNETIQLRFSSASLNAVNTANITTTTLPLDWLYFTAAEQGNTVLLQWATAFESNTAFFAIERSADGLNWKELGRVKAAANSSNRHTYQFIDEAVLPGTGFYRLRQVDIDGKFSFSRVASATAGGANALFQMYQNPVVNGIMRIRLAAPSLLKVTNAAGQLMWQGRLDQGQQQINVQGWPRGLYLLSSHQSSIRFMIE